MITRLKEVRYNSLKCIRHYFREFSKRYCSSIFQGIICLLYLNKLMTILYTHYRFKHDKQKIFSIDTLKSLHNKNRLMYVNTHLVEFHIRFIYI